MSQTFHPSSRSASSGREATIGDVLEAINDFATSVEERFSGVDNRLEGLEKRLTHVENIMVTKDYLDRKLFEFRGDIVLYVQKHCAI